MDFESFFFVYQVEARERAHITRQETRAGRGKHKLVGNKDMRRSVEGRGMGRGTQGKQDGTTWIFTKENREFEGAAFGVG